LICVSEVFGSLGLPEIGSLPSQPSFFAEVAQSTNLLSPVHDTLRESDWDIIAKPSARPCVRRIGASFLKAEWKISLLLEATTLM
jgi:hypothetical protein